jgi:hypothetical protein
MENIVDKMLEGFEKLSIIENNTTNIDKRLSNLEDEVKEIKSIVTLNDLKDLKNNRIETIHLRNLVDNIKEDLKKDVKSISLMNGGISATAVTTIIIGLFEYFSKGQ